MKILKKVFVIDGENTTSFRMKYAVEDILDNRKYETEPVGSSLEKVVDQEGYNFVEVSKPLKDVGVIEVQIDYENEGLQFIFNGNFKMEMEKEDSNRRKCVDVSRGKKNL